MTTFRLPQENPLYLLAVNFQGVSNGDVKAQILLILLMPGAVTKCSTMQDDPRE